MPEVTALQRDLGSAIAQLQVIQKLLIEVFDWSSTMGCIRAEDKTAALMKIQICRTSFPVIDIALRDYFKQFNVTMGDRIELVPDKGTGK
jgi:hypothetical protein